MHTKKEFELRFDTAKSGRNIEERGMSFDQAADFDFTTALYWLETGKNFSEQRVFALGMRHGRVHSLVFTETSTGIRFISLRKANSSEVKRYEQEINA